ncbi:hypothetical protein F2Q70_00034847 [Brassica cretica]|uniref:Uncharacterized protein n=1 Tax=Brassica cretica TaxID=69181 RepID=A0A8S9JW82_BRACR|nr:hypothetical protein F2Q70_00034847 [Brassica cretica]
MSSEVYYRSWMDKPHLDPNTNLLTEEYVQGIGEFMRLVQQQPDAKSGASSSPPLVSKLCCRTGSRISLCSDKGKAAMNSPQELLVSLGFALPSPSMIPSPLSQASKPTVSLQLQQYIKTCLRLLPPVNKTSKVGS